MNLLDHIIRETERRQEPRTATFGYFRVVPRPEAESHRGRLSALSALAERSGPKGALAGHLEELLRLS